MGDVGCAAPKMVLSRDQVVQCGDLAQGSRGGAAPPADDSAGRAAAPR